MDFSSFWSSAIWVPLLSFGILLLVDTLLAVILAVKGKFFSWELLGQWVQKCGLEGAGLVLLGALAAVRAEVFAAFYPALATVDASLIKQIIDKIKAFTTIEVVFEEEDEMETVGISPN